MSHRRVTCPARSTQYAGTSDRLDRAMCRFARSYADQTEANHEAL
jgi:hypothetical protein